MELILLPNIPINVDVSVRATRLELIRHKDLAAARKAGLDDAQINEVVANVTLNVLTNYINRVAGTEVDLPLLALDNAA